MRPCVRAAARRGSNAAARPRHQDPRVPLHAGAEAPPPDHRRDPPARGGAHGAAGRRGARADRARSAARIAERVGALRDDVEALKKAKHDCADPDERDDIDRRLAGREQELSARHGGDPRRAAPRGVRDRARGMPPPRRHHGDGHRPRVDLGHGAVRRAAHRRHRAAPGEDRRDGDRRGQDAGRGAAALPQRAPRQRRPPGHGQQLPGPPRLAVDGPRPDLAGPHRRVHRRHGARHDRAARRVPGRHHLRHQQRVRVRLPARQHGLLAGAARPAEPIPTPSWTRWTRSSSTRPARRSSSRAPSATRPTPSTPSTTRRW